MLQVLVVPTRAAEGEKGGKGDQGASEGLNEASEASCDFVAVLIGLHAEAACEPLQTVRCFKTCVYWKDHTLSPSMLSPKSWVQLTATLWSARALHHCCILCTCRYVPIHYDTLSVAVHGGSSS